MKRFVALLVVVLLVAGLWSAAWFYAAGEVRSQVAALALNDGETAPQLTCGGFEVTGFPFRFDLTCTDAVLISNDVMVTVPGIKSSLLVYNPTHVLVSASAPIGIADAFTGSESRLSFTGLQASLRVTAADLFKGFSGEGWRVARASLVGDGIEWVDTIAAEMLFAKASHAEVQIVDMPEWHDKAAGLSGLAAYVTAKDVVAPLYDIAAGEAELQAEVTGLPDDLRVFAEPDIVSRWQAAGGRLNLVSLKGTAGAEMIDASGTLGLDASHMLEGDVTYTTRGIKERFQASPMIDPISLTILTGLPQADGTLKQALQFNGGAVRVGGIPLLKLEPLY